MVSRHKCRYFSFHRDYYRSRIYRCDVTDLVEESEQRSIFVTAALGQKRSLRDAKLGYIEGPLLATTGTGLSTLPTSVNDAVE